MRFINFIISILFVNISLSAQVFNFYPESKTHCELIKHSFFRLCYNEADEQAQWVAYMLTSEMVKNNICKRSDNFRPDPSVSTGSATLADYKGSGYDRGHLCPAGDMGFDCIAMSETFYMSNMSPQFPSFNRGIWKSLEEKVRNWADTYDTVYVVTGPVLNEPIDSIGKSKVTVPKYYYKAVYRSTIKGGTCIALVLPNESGDEPLESYVISVDSLETLTNIDFFPALPDSIEQTIEKNINTKKWEFNR